MFIFGMCVLVGGGGGDLKGLVESPVLIFLNFVRRGFAKYKHFSKKKQMVKTNVYLWHVCVGGGGGGGWIKFFLPNYKIQGPRFAIGAGNITNTAVLNHPSFARK